MIVCSCYDKDLTNEKELGRVKEERSCHLRVHLPE